MSFRKADFYVFPFLLSTLAVTPAVADDTVGQNSHDLLKAAETAFEKGDIPTAASLSNLAMMKYRADLYCFPPADRTGSQDDFEYGEARLGEKLRAATLGDPEIVERMVADMDAWAPTGADGYDPGWKTASRCKDYAGFVKEIKAQMLPSMQRATTLLKIPEYRKAFLTFSDVMQDYDQPPPDDAYSPARVAALAEAVRTMQAIETKQGQPYFGQMAAMDTSKPVAFRVIASGQASHSVVYRDEVDPSMDNGKAHLIRDKAALARLWQTIYGDAPSSPAVPVVDFSKQVVVAATEQSRSVNASRMFISRIELGDSPFPSLIIYMRIPVWREDCFPQRDTVYPYAVAVLDRPDSMPTTAGYDSQNFPAPGCPER